MGFFSRRRSNSEEQPSRLCVFEEDEEEEVHSKQGEKMAAVNAALFKQLPLVLFLVLTVSLGGNAFAFEA